MTKIRTIVDLAAASYLDACTVKGYFLDHYPAIRDLKIDINSRGCEIRLITIQAIDKFDRTIDFTNSHQYLRNHNKCLPRLDFYPKKIINDDV